MHVVIFEGSRWPTFAPIALSRPVFTLVSGMSTLLEKQVRHLRPTRLTLWVRPELEEHCRVRVLPTLSVPTDVNVPLDDEPALVVTGRMLMFSSFEVPHEPCVATEETDLARFAYVRSPGLTHEDVMRRTDRWLKVHDLPRAMAQGRMVETLWDLIHWNEESLVEDAIQMGDEGRRPHPAGPYHMVRDEDVRLGEGVKLAPGCVLDASRGPVVLGEHVQVGANTVIEGPCYVGPHGRVQPLTHIRAGTTLGPVCKVGGEVSNSIVLGYSNKSHGGYLGDSYLGKWVNLGSGTTTANLKTTYGEIHVRVGGKDVPTGRRFLGALVGDHTKTAVETRLAPGSYIGFCTTLNGSAFAPRFVPSYSYWTDAGMEPYRVDKAIDVTRQVFARRDRVFTDYDDRMMRHVAEVAKRVEG